MDKVSVLLDQAKREMAEGNFAAAQFLLAPLLEMRHPEAEFLCSTFSVAGAETQKAFERRSAKLLKSSAAAKFPAAMYALAVCLENGDLVKADPLRAAELFKQAARAGYAKAKLSHGLNLYYGSHGVRRSRTRGLQLIRVAAHEGVKSAAEVLRELS